jgi:hypothetical protein
MTELLTDPGHMRGDLRQIAAAIRKGWVIPDQLLEHVPKVLGTLVIKGKPREQVAAAMALLKMKEANDRAEGIDRPQQQAPQTTINVGVSVDGTSETRRSRTLAIAQRFGTGGVLRESASEDR